MSEQPSIHRFPWYGLTSTVLMLAALTGADVLALDAPPADVSAKWWGENWGTVSTSARELRPGDTFTVSATTLEGGIGEPRWLWVDIQKYLATGTKSVRIGWNSLGDALELVSYTSGPTNTEVIEGPNSVQWTAPPPHSAPGGSNPGDPPPPEAPPPRFGMGTTFSVTLKVRDPNEPNFPDGAWEAWKNVHANFTGNVGYTGWTDAALTYVALKGGASLKAELIADPEQVALDEPFQLKLRLTNNGQFELTNIKPVMDNDNKPRIVPADSVEIVSGPDPASISTLAPGMSSTILYECTMTEEGTVELSLGAEATCSEPDQPDPVTPDGTPTATVEGADVIKLNSASVDPSEKQIVPGDRVEFTFSFNKKHEDEVKLVLSPQQFFEPVNADAIKRENLLGEWVPMPDGVVPADVTGQFNVKAEVRVADETHQQIYTKVVRYYPGKIDLTNHRFFDAEFKINGEQRSLELFATIDGMGIEFPDYLGDGALPTSDPPPSAEALDYYLHGSTDADMAEATGDEVVPYYESTYVRYVALQAIRGEGAETPDEAGVAIVNLANYLAARLPSEGDGIVWPVTTTSSWLKNDAQLPAMSSIGQAQLMGAFARTIGLPAREMDVSLRHVAGIFSTDYHWAQHAASQIWYDGAWHWFDLYYDDRNGNAPVTDAGYPGFYFRNGSLFCSYREMKAFYAAKQLNKDMYGLKEGGYHFSGEPELYGDVWHLYDSCTREEVENADSRRMHITTHSPVTTLYMDAQGRRLGAAMGLNSQDMRPIAETDDIEPVRGGGSVWEVPGGIYIAPGTPLMRGENPDDWILLEEQIIVPFDELTDGFKLIVTGVGSGDYRVQVWIDNGAEGTFDLYDYEGTITEGATEELEFGTDLSDAKPVIASGPNGPGPNPNAKDPADGTGQDTPSAGGCCGAAAPAMMLLWCLAAGMMRRRRRGA